MIHRSIGRGGLATAALGLAALLASCGGGAVGSGGTGAPAVVQGTVTGYGSLIVDGQRFDDRDVLATTESSPGRATPVAPRLGQRVEVEFEVEGLATAIRVVAEARGVVSEVLPQGLRLLGQTVVVNTDAARGPVTLFAGGYRGLGDLRLADAVEVHGVARRDGLSYLIQATRIERLAAPPVSLTLAGPVSAVDVSARRLVIGGLAVAYDSAAVLPAGRSPAVGDRVVVLADADGFVVDSQGLRLVATQLRIAERRSGATDGYVGGVVGGLEVTAGRFDLGGVPVELGAAVVTPASATLANGQYVQVRGRYADDGTLRAAHVKIRKLSGEPDVELRGTVVELQPGGTRFSLRGVAVDAGAARVAACPSRMLADGLYVEVDGTVDGNGVMAQRVRCVREPDGAVVERVGQVDAVDPAERSFTLVPGAAAAITVRWSETTFFGDLSPEALAGRRVAVEGRFGAGELHASRVRVLP